MVVISGENLHPVTCGGRIGTFKPVHFVFGHMSLSRNALFREGATAEVPGRSLNGRKCYLRSHGITN